MANIRQDNAQLIITIDAKESAEYQKSLQRSAELSRNIKKMSVGTDEYNAALKEQAEISKKLAQTDYTKLSIKDLSDRRKSLQQQINILPQVTAAELGLEEELRQVNTALAENAKRTKAVNQVMVQTTPAASGFFATFKKGLAFLSPLALYEGIEQVGSSLIGLGKDAVIAFDEAAKAQAQLEAVIKSTGGAAGKAVEELLAQSAELQKITLFSDDQVQEAQGLLLTFTKVGGDIYDQAIPAILDMATAMKTDLSTASVQVGKALNDPVKGVTALSKAGVQFTDDQKNMIKELVKSGDVVGAQTIILKELETQFSGSAKAAADAGLGPFQKFQNRIGDLKEGIGQLITNGLGFLGPILDTVATFAEKFVGVLVTGKKATGDLSGGVNFLVGALKIVVSVVSGVISKIAFLWELQQRLVASLKELPVIGLVIKAFAATFNFLVDAVSNTAAVFSGLKAAIQQTFDNASNYIKKVLTDLKIFAKEADLLLSFKDSTKERIKGEIQALEAERAQYAKAGKTVGQAYIDAYNDVIKKEAQASKIVNTLARNNNTGGNNNNTNTGGDNKSTKTKTEKPKDSIGLFDFDVYDPAVAQAALDFRLKQMEDAAKREQSILEESYLQGKLTQEQYELERLRITQSGLATRIELLDTYGQQESDKRRELNIELLKIEDEIIRERAAQIGDLESAQLSQLESEFARRLISEEEYNLSRLRIQLNFYDEQLRMLEDAGLTETDVYDKISSEKLKIQGEYNDKLVENERRTQALKAEIQREGLSVLSDLFSLGAELLGKDEKARKKHGEAIKKFETASIIINRIAEIAENYKQSAKLGPIIGPILGTIRAIATTVRAGIAISKVNAQQFFRGGKIRTVSGELIDMQPNIPAQAGGDNVLIAAKPGEVVLNKDQQNALGGPEVFKSIGVPGFNTGGVILPRTIPNISPNVISGRAASSGEIRIDQLMMAVETMVAAVAGVPAAISNMDIKTHVVYNDFEKAQNTINEIKRLSSYGSN